MPFALLLGAGLFCAAALRPAANAADTRTYYFREPQSAAYVVANQQAVGRAAGGSPAWISARTGGQEVELGQRLVVGLSGEASLEPIVAGRPLRLDRLVSPGPHSSARTYIFQADNALAAAREADAISRLPGVVVSCPVIRRSLARHSRYAELPNDELFGQQWHLENRNPAGARAGADLNVRAAWPLSRGKNIAIAIADDGVDLRHPELESRAVNMPHFNFLDRNLSGEPADGEASHGTAVAGLALAELNNSVGVAGVAPEARLASWVVLGRVGLSDEDAMDMYQHRLDVIDVQNHSWGSADNGLNPVRFLEQIGLSNGVTFGRAGRGTVIVRSAGNGKGGANNANDYGHANDPRVIAVGAVRFDGRVTSYSERGACVLVSAPSADASLEFPTILTTDRQGALGYNGNSYTNDLADYAFDTNGFSGTSASAPQISGMVALMLAANPNLTYRDVQHVLVNASRHLDLADPALATNGAGFRVSHNVGFGVPDAGRAVRLALQWTNLPPLTNVSVLSAARFEIPDDSLLAVSADGLPEALTAPAALPSLGPEFRVASAFVPLVDVGLATNALSRNLTGKAAFIQRGTNFFRDKIEIAAAAGAAFAIIYNNRDTNELVQMAATDFTPIPAVFIGQNDGDAIAAFLQTNAVAVQLRPAAVPARVSLTVTETLICEHVGVRLRTDHSRRGDLRIVLTSPSGTRSVLQHQSFDDAPGPLDWIYYSTQHFYEPTAGTWELAVSDERKSQSGGGVLSVELRLAGWPIVDADADGLDDAWETNYFGALSFGARDDPDQDGYGNAQEQILRSNPVRNDVPFAVDISRLNPGQTRLSWPSSSHFAYRILAAGDAGQPLVPVTNVVADFPETEWIAPASASRLFRLEAVIAR